MTNANNNETMEVERETDDIGPLFVNRWVDCQDSYHKWYEAQIVEIDRENKNRYKVHYKGWKTRFDEWIDVSKDGERIRVLHTFTPQGKKFSGDIELRKGIKCDVLDSTDKWYQAQVIEHDKINNYVKFHYTLWSSSYDEWINCDSYRIAPLYTKTSKTTHTNINNSNKNSNKTTKSTTFETNTNVNAYEDNNKNSPHNSNNSSRKPIATPRTRCDGGNSTSNNNSNRGIGSGGNIVRRKMNSRGVGTSHNFPSVPIATPSTNVEDENDQKHGFNGANNKSNNNNINDTHDKTDDERKMEYKKAWNSLSEAEKEKRRKNVQIRIQYMLNFKPTRQQEVKFCIL